MPSIFISILQYITNKYQKDYSLEKMEIKRDDVQHEGICSLNDEINTAWPPDSQNNT